MGFKFRIIGKQLEIRFYSRCSVSLTTFMTVGIVSLGQVVRNIFHLKSWLVVKFADGISDRLATHDRGKPIMHGGR